MKKTPEEINQAELVTKSRVLIVDDEKKICEILKDILESEGYIVEFVLNGYDALKRVQKNDIDVILLDIKLPDTNGITILKGIKELNPEIGVIIISAFGTVSLAVEALKNGAIDFIEKPFDVNRILPIIKNSIERAEIIKQRNQLREAMLKEYKVIGVSNKMKAVMEWINRVAQTDGTVLIMGETGTGKELVARNIHFRGLRAGKPLVKVNCAALPKELIESELFGYEKGAFTGAYTCKLGQFELANTGTLFLDEIGDMSLSAQSKVLRAIEDKEIQRLGGIKPINVDVRLIAATNKNLKTLVEEEKFREDLFHRINVLAIEIPPLRERKEDIIILAEHFLKENCINYNQPLKTLSDDAKNYLYAQRWHGNVRELKHLMEKFAIFIDRTNITLDDINRLLKMEPTQKVPIKIVKGELERDYIISALNQTDWHISKAAKLLGIDRTTLFRKMKKLGIKV